MFMSFEGDFVGIVCLSEADDFVDFGELCRTVSSALIGGGGGGPLFVEGFLERP